MPATLLDVLMEQRESSGKGLQTMTRVCLMGRLTAGTTAPSFSSWCEKALLPMRLQVTGMSQVWSQSPPDVGLGHGRGPMRRITVSHGLAV